MSYNMDLFVEGLIGDICLANKCDCLKLTQYFCILYNMT